MVRCFCYCCFVAVCYLLLYLCLTLWFEQEDTLRVAVFQGGNLDAKSNLVLMDEFLGSCAKTRSADVVVFPELFLTGYDNAPFAEALEENWDQHSEVKTIVARHDLAVVVGLAEREGSKLFNTVAFFEGNGKLLMKHRKTHLWGEFERKVKGK